MFPEYFQITSAEYLIGKHKAFDGVLLVGNLEMIVIPFCLN